MQETLKFIMNELENVYTLCAYTEEEYPEKYVDRFMDELSENDTLLVLTDLEVGSVNQIFLKKLKNRKFYLITGMNFGLLLELYLLPENEVSQKKIKEIVEISKLGTKCMCLEEMEDLDQKEDTFF